MTPVRLEPAVPTSLVKHSTTDPLCSHCFFCADIHFCQEYHGGETVWIQVSPDILSSLIWVQTVCEVYQPSSKDYTASRQRVYFADVQAD